ncbi:hypothetical protein, partial [Acinetobacter lactucae]|uniref:hypothetical protein n=1 Tax=Acinetobacter lactucae TaxID=1785128 RepID=UPI001C711411
MIKTLIIILNNVFYITIHSKVSQIFRFFLGNKKHPHSKSGGVCNNELAMTYSHMGNPTLPSALRGFTSE